VKRVPQRPLSAVPQPVRLLLGLTLAAQLAWHGTMPRPEAKAVDLPAPPSLAALRLASLGEPIAASRLLMLYVQAFDVQPGILVRYAELDYERLRAWLSRLLALDPRSGYPLFAASRIYAEVPDPARQRVMLDFIYREFFRDPHRRWPYLAQAALLAKHRLDDLPLALQYAEAIRERATGPDVPDWAAQMSVFILEDMDELESAKVLLGALLTEGKIKDPNEARYLKGYLERLEQRSGRNR
jgi:hypothetical protein